MTAHVVELLEWRGALATLLRGSRGASGRPSLQRLRRLATLLAQVPRLAVWRARGSRRLYLPSDSSSAGLTRIVVTVAAARALGYTVVLHHHVFTYVDRTNPVMRAICRVGGRRLDHVLLCDLMARGFTDRYRPRGASVVVSNVAFTGSTGAAAPVPRDPLPLRIGLFGNLNEVKGVPAFLEVARRYGGEPDVEFHAAGPVALDVAEAVRQSEARGEAVFHGPQHGEAKATFLAGLDLLLFPSTYAAEAEPMVIWEAIALGVPVVAYRRGCVDAQLPASHVVPEADIDALEAWVAAFVADPAPARRTAARLQEGLDDAAAAALDDLVTAVAGAGDARSVG